MYRSLQSPVITKNLANPGLGVHTTLFIWTRLSDNSLRFKTLNPLSTQTDYTFQDFICVLAEQRRRRANAWVGIGVFDGWAENLDWTA